MLNPWMRSICPLNNTDTRSMTPGVSILANEKGFIAREKWYKIKDVRLALEVFHDIQKVVVYIRLVLELQLDRVKIAKSVGDIELANRLWSLVYEGCYCQRQSLNGCRRYERRRARLPASLERKLLIRNSETFDNRLQGGYLHA